MLTVCYTSIGGVLWKLCDSQLPGFQDGRGHCGPEQQVTGKSCLGPTCVPWASVSTGDGGSVANTQSLWESGFRARLPHRFSAPHSLEALTGNLWTKAVNKPRRHPVTTCRTGLQMGFGSSPTTSTGRVILSQRCPSTSASRETPRRRARRPHAGGTRTP